MDFSQCLRFLKIGVLDGNLEDMMGTWQLCVVGLCKNDTVVCNSSSEKFLPTCFKIPSNIRILKSGKGDSPSSHIPSLRTSSTSLSQHNMHHPLSHLSCIYLKVGNFSRKLGVTGVGKIARGIRVTLS